MLPTYNNNNSNTGAAKPSSPIIPLQQPLEAYICRSFLRHGHCRYGGCAHRPSVSLHGVSLHGGDYARLASLTPPASDGSSSSEDERRPTEERRYHHDPPPGPLVAGSLQQQQQLTGHHNLVFLPELPLWAVTTTPATVAVAESVATSHQQQALEGGGGSSGGCKYLHLSPDEVVPTLERLVREGWGFVTCCINHQNRSGCTRFGHHAPMCKYLHISRKEEAEWATFMSPHVKELRMAHKLREDKKRAEKDNNSPHASRDVTGGAHRIETRIVAGLDPSQPQITIGGTASLGYCQQFLRGHCYRGTECRFRHIDPSASSSAPVAAPVAITEQLRGGGSAGMSPPPPHTTLLLPHVVVLPVGQVDHYQSATQVNHHAAPAQRLSVQPVSSSSPVHDDDSGNMEMIVEILRELRQDSPSFES